MAKGESIVMLFGGFLTLLGGYVIHDAIFHEFGWDKLVVGTPITLLGLLMLIFPNLKPPPGFDLH